MKKIVCISGSPRKDSNSLAIAQRVMDAAGELGAESQTFRLFDIAFDDCVACMGCKTGAEEFVHQDGATPGAVHRWWGRHLHDTREQTLIEFYLASWGRGLAAPTFAEQIETVVNDVRFNFSAHSWQTRRHKLDRIALAARRLGAPSSRHLKSG